MSFAVRHDHPSALSPQPSSLLALLALAILAVVLGVNLINATKRFVSAYDAWDSLGLELTEFHYTDPYTPIRAQLVVSNPTGQTIEVREIELRLSAGVHPVGGDQIRPATDPEAATSDVEEKYRLDPGERQSYRLDLAIDDADYVARLGAENIDWRLRGRILVSLDEGIEDVWIPFVVRHLPE